VRRYARTRPSTRPTIDAWDGVHHQPGHLGRRLREQALGHGGRNRGYAASTAINFLVGVCIFSGTYLFALYCGTVMRFLCICAGMAAGLVLVFVLKRAARA
jgi:hypothetical protein